MSEDKQAKLALREKESEALESVKVGDILGDRLTIEVKNLVVGQQARKQISLGEPTGLIHAVQNLMDKIDGVIWNEDRLHLVLKGGDEIRFQPEMIPSAGIFFRRKPKSRYEDSDDQHQGPVVWEGDYEPVRFTKRNFVRYLKENVTAFDPEMRDSIKELKVSHVRTVTSEMIEEDTDNERTVSADAQYTNVPKKFAMSMPLAEGWDARLEFETEPCSMDGRRGATVGIEVTCTNARKVRREMMESILARLPDSIPRYYGAMKVIG